MPPPRKPYNRDIRDYGVRLSDANRCLRGSNGLRSVVDPCSSVVLRLLRMPMVWFVLGILSIVAGGWGTGFVMLAIAALMGAVRGTAAPQQ